MYICLVSLDNRYYGYFLVSLDMSRSAIYAEFKLHEMSRN